MWKQIYEGSAFTGNFYVSMLDGKIYGVIKESLKLDSIVGEFQNKVWLLNIDYRAQLCKQVIHASVCMRLKECLVFYRTLLMRRWHSVKFETSYRL
jgi:hypothetical protein